MNIKTIVMTIAATLALSGALLAQSGFESSLLECRTSDGIVTIKDRTVELRDYKFTVQDVTSEGVIMLVDDRARTSASLDPRDPSGLYLTVREGANRMLVVAAKKNMTLKGSPKGNDAGSPASEDYNIIDAVSAVQTSNAGTTLTASIK